MVSARGCSSRSSATEPSSFFTANIAFANRFSSIARAAFCWLASANLSTSVRVKPFARRDQVGRDALRHQVQALAQLLVERRRASPRPSPSARATSTRRRRRCRLSMKPAPIFAAIEFTASRPEPQNRLIVKPVTSSGHCAAISATRAMHAPCSLTCVTQPTARSSTRLLVELLALRHVVQRLREQLLRVDVREPALAGLAAAARRAKCVVDEDVSHETLLVDAGRMGRNVLGVKGLDRAGRGSHALHSRCKNRPRWGSPRCRG